LFNPYIFYFFIYFIALFFSVCTCWRVCLMIMASSNRLHHWGNRVPFRVQVELLLNSSVLLICTHCFFFVCVGQLCLLTFLWACYFLFICLLAFLYASFDSNWNCIMRQSNYVLPWGRESLSFWAIEECAKFDTLSKFTTPAWFHKSPLIIYPAMISYFSILGQCLRKPPNAFYGLT